MALQITKLVRQFNYKKDGKEIPMTDPNPALSAEEVMKFYSGTYPDLTNALVEGPKIVNDKSVYIMTAKAGKLG